MHLGRRRIRETREGIAQPHREDEQDRYERELPQNQNLLQYKCRAGLVVLRRALADTYLVTYQ